MISSHEVANFKESSGLHLLKIEAPEDGSDIENLISSISPQIGAYRDPWTSLLHCD